MTHNPADRIAKMMREIRAFDPHADIMATSWLSRAMSRSRDTWFVYVYCGRRVGCITRSQKPERCVRKALKQVRKIRVKV